GAWRGASGGPSCPLHHGERLRRAALAVRRHHLQRELLGTETGTTTTEVVRWVTRLEVGHRGDDGGPAVRQVEASGVLVVAGRPALHVGRVLGIADPLGVAADDPFGRRFLAVTVGRRDRDRDTAQDGDEGDPHDRDGHHQLHHRLTALASCATRPDHLMFTWLKMPYIADTSAIATKPTMRPMITMTAGSN